MLSYHGHIWRTRGRAALSALPELRFNDSRAIRELQFEQFPRRGAHGPHRGVRTGDGSLRSAQLDAVDCVPGAESAFAPAAEGERQILRSALQQRRGVTRRDVFCGKPGSARVPARSDEGFLRKEMQGALPRAAAASPRAADPGRVRQKIPVQISALCAFQSKTDPPWRDASQRGVHDMFLFHPPIEPADSNEHSS